jgi:plastocyanin
VTAIVLHAALLIGVGAVLVACGGEDRDLPPATPDAQGQIVITIDDSRFDAEEIIAPAGEVTIVLQNNDRVPHNIHVHEGDSNDGDTVGETPLERGPREDMLTMTLEAGEYYFVCDLHRFMDGTLLVPSAAT